MEENGYPLAAAVSPDGETLCLSSVSMANAAVKTNISFYNFGSAGQKTDDHLVQHSDFIDEVIPFLHYFDNTTCVCVSDKQLFCFWTTIFRSSGSTYVQLPDNVLGVFCGDSFVGILSTNTKGDTQYRLDLYNKRGKHSGSVNFTMQYTDIDIAGDKIYIHNDQECQIFTAGGRCLFKGKFEKPVYAVIPGARLSDLLVDLGATSMMSESIEWIGGEHVVAKRAATSKIHNEIIEICRAYEDHLKAAGQDCRAGQPTPGNKAGGLSTLDEKSLGCIRKGGTRPIVEVLEQAQKPTKHGAVVMDTAGYDISSVTSMVAGGCQVVIFTTGRGTPTGNAIVPVLKVTANSRTYQRMEDNMDVDLSAIIRGEKTYKEMGAELLNTIHEVANGRLTKAEAYGFSDIAVDHVCRYV